MLEVLIPADPLKAPADQGGTIHNRWHPDIPMVAMVSEFDAARALVARELAHLTRHGPRLRLALEACGAQLTGLVQPQGPQ